MSRINGLDGVPAQACMARHNANGQMPAQPGDEPTETSCHTRLGQDELQLPNPHMRRRQIDLGVFDFNRAGIACQRHIADRSPLEPIDPSASSRLRIHWSPSRITTASDAHHSSVVVCEHLFDHLPLIAQNPRRNSCPQFGFPPESSKDPSEYSISETLAIPFYRSKAWKSPFIVHRQA